MLFLFLKLHGSKKDYYMKKILAGLLLATALTGCSTMTIQPSEQIKRSSMPTFEKTIPFYFWGLKGEDRVNVKAVCGDKKPVQMQTQMTLENGLLTFITLGIYAPHTAKVWCE
jgi:hypothetical protein